MENFDLPIEFQQLVKSEQAYYYRIIPVGKKNEIVLLKTDASDRISLQNELGVLLSFKVELEMILLII